MKRTYLGLALAGTLAVGAYTWASNAAETAPKWLANIPVTSAKPFGFDISASADGKYYLADGANATLDVFDTKTATLLNQIKADFAGIGPNHDKSGPSGVTPVPGTSAART